MVEIGKLDLLISATTLSCYSVGELLVEGPLMLTFGKLATVSSIRGSICIIVLVLTYCFGVGSVSIKFGAKSNSEVCVSRILVSS